MTIPVDVPNSRIDRLVDWLILGSAFVMLGLAFIGLGKALSS